MDKNMIIAILLSILVVVGFQYVLKDYLVPPETPKQEAVKTAEKALAEKSAPGPVVTAKAVKKAAGAKVVKEKAEKTIEVENDLYRAVLSSKGASVRQVELKKYKDDNGKPVILKADETLPALALGLDDGLQYAFSDFEVVGSSVKLNENKKSADIIFEYRDKAGAVGIKRTFTFSNGDYAIAVRDEIVGIGSYFLTLGKKFGIFDKESSDHVGPILLKDTELIDIKPKDVKDGPKSYSDKIRWIAQEDKYFAAFIVPKGNVEEVRSWTRDGNAVIAARIKGGDNSYLFYAGPKDIHILEKYNAGMEHIIDFGFFSIIARPLFWLLEWINGIVNNYGFSIIIFTIITRIPFIPLINKGQKSMKRMADMQPKLAALREQFKNDPQRMQKELMALYKKHKINPIGGCLPVGLQIPFFFALLSILSTAIEMRQAPFIWWITDLAGPDNLFGMMFNLPFIIGPLPLLMGATMFWQQKMTPSTGDPMQQKMMLFLPVIFTVMFLSFSSGLVLFWLINNILSIIQQYYINRQVDAEVVA
jgi:YidC/Oxa1 family membrane protein insertase